MLHNRKKTTTQHSKDFRLTLIIAINVKDLCTPAFIFHVWSEQEHAQIRSLNEQTVGHVPNFIYNSLK